MNVWMQGLITANRMRTGYLFLTLKKQKGFTLIEILVVIAVITVLLAVSLPVVHRIRSVGKRVQCASNCRQIGLAWEAYLSDNQDAFPQSKNNIHITFGGWEGAMRWWPRPLNPYAGLRDQREITSQEARLFCCPADRGGSPEYALNTVYIVNGNSYCTNILLVGQDQIGDSRDPVINKLHQGINERLKNMNRDKVTNNPSKVLFFGDFGWIFQWDYDPNEMLPEDMEKREWHDKSGFYNIAFLDGHVDFLKIQHYAYRTDDYDILPFMECNHLVP